MSSFIEALPNGPPYHFQDRIRQAAFNESQLHLVNDISRRYAELHHELSSLKRRLEDRDAPLAAPDSKKRKLEDGSATTGVPAAGVVPTSSPTFQAENISFVTPQRKKFKVGLVPDSPAGSGGLTMDGSLAIRWGDIEQVICVSVPEKATPAHYFVLIPTQGVNLQGAGAIKEPIVFTVPDTAPQEVTLAAGQAAAPPGILYHELFTKLLDAELQKHGKRTVFPDPREFQSAIVQAHRKGEKGYHVKAFRGSKDGYLYFLSRGILFGFKKPLLFFPLHSITSISYSSILQRTFNLNVSAQLSSGDCTFCIPGASPDGKSEAEFEFSMLDQADFAGIDAYVKGHGLHDASLAEGRRAKKYNVNASAANGANGVKGAAAAVVGGAGGEDGGGFGGAPEVEEEESELARAERELQDREDEEEEDYEESGGESDGSGTDSEEEDGQGEEVVGDGEEDLGDGEEGED